MQDVARQGVEPRCVRPLQRLAQPRRHDRAGALVPLVHVPVGDGAREGAASAAEVNVISIGGQLILVHPLVGHHVQTQSNKFFKAFVDGIEACELEPLSEEDKIDIQ